MLEYFIMTLSPVILSILALVYNNFDDIRSKKGLKSKFAELLKFKKNKLLLIPFTLFGIGIMFWSHMYFKDSLEISLKMLYVYELLICVAYIDYIKGIIPNKLIIFAFFSYFVFFAFEAIVKNASVSALLVRAGLGLILGGGVFGLCSLLTKGSMGMGDVKLFAVLGILLGFQAVFNVIFFSVLLVALYGIFAMIFKKKDKKTTVPLGPFALAGMMVSIVLGIGGML